MTRAVRVALDMAHVRLASAGTARYATGLRAALATRDDVDLVTLGHGPRVPRGSGAARYATVLRHDLHWYPRAGRRAARRAGADVYHVPILRGGLTAGSPQTVVTVHDLVMLRHPETMGTWNRAYSRATMRRVVNAADAIVAVSADTADDVVRLLGAAAERVHVIPPGIAARWFAPVESHAVDPHADPYVLFVGTPEPRKNLPRLVAAMQELRARGRTERLVIVGAEGWGRTAGSDPAFVERLGRVDDAELHRLYAGAACVAVPSLHEGFGLTAIEALASGAPVVAARAGALPEVCGDAVRYVDPLDVSDIAAGIHAVLTGDTPSRERRIARAAQFSWSRCAAAMVALYQSLAIRAPGA